MLPPLILTGGPAVGKTTCGRALAERRERAAYIDADDVRQLVVVGAVAPWKGPEGAAQHRLAARNAAVLARNLLLEGFEVVIADVLTADALATFRRELPGCFVVHLRISLDGARQRAATRAVHLTPAEFELLHRAASSPPGVEAVLDVEGLDRQQQIALIQDAWTASGQRERHPSEEGAAQHRASPRRA